MADKLFYILGDLQVVLALHIFCQKMFGLTAKKSPDDSSVFFRTGAFARYAAVILYVIIDCLVYFLFDNAAVFFTTSIILYFLFSLAYSLRICLKNLIATFLFIAFGVCSELIAAFSVSFAVDIFGGHVIDNEIVATTLLSRIIFFILLVITKHIINFQNKDDGTDISFLLTLVIPVLSVFIVMYLFSLSSFNQQSILDSDSVGAYLSVISIIIMNVLAFYIFDRFHRVGQIEKEDIRLKQTIIAQQNHFDEEQNVRENIRKMKHDYKNILVALKTDIENGNTERVLAVIKNELGSIAEMQLPSSNNLTIDSIMSYKASAVSDKGIKITPEYRIEEEIDIDSSDICILIGNALDNAIEYLGNHPECEQAINVRIIGEKGVLDIRITNEISNDVVIIDNMIESGKPEAGHGYGLKSARYIAEKHGGLMKLNCTNKLFSFEAVLYDNK